MNTVQLLIVLLCVTTTSGSGSGNWTVVNPEIDLETIPLEIKTDSTIGSGDKVFVRFYTSGGETLEYVEIRFFSTPQHYISNCRSYTNFPVSLPTEVEKVWRITLNRNSGIRFLIHCNNVEVLNFVMSYTCNSYWSRTVGKVSFNPYYDTASDYYRAGHTGTNSMNMPSPFYGKIKLPQHNLNHISIKNLNNCSDITFIAVGYYGRGIK